MGDGELFVGTLGQGLWRSADDGESWAPEPGVAPDARLFALAGDAETLFAGARGAVYRRTRGRWTTLALDDPELETWALAVDPESPATVYAGCRPLALLRSDDAGVHWKPLDLALPAGTERPHTPRVTSILAERDTLWCGVEVGGVFASRDGGHAFAPVSEGLPSLDVHALARGRALVAATPRGIGRRDGDGRWTTADLRAPFRYCRALAPLPGRPGALLCGLGDGPPGTRGAVVLTEDDGRTWHSARFPGTAASSVWSVAVAPGGDGRALAGAIGGELFLSEDRGYTWRALARTFAEIRAVFIA